MSTEGISPGRFLSRNIEIVKLIYNQGLVLIYNKLTQLSITKPRTYNRITAISIYGNKHITVLNENYSSISSK